MVSILSTNRNLKDKVKEGMNNMLKIDIEQTPLYEIGFEKATFENAIVMIEKFKISIDDIVKELNIKKEELLEYIKNREENK